MTVIIKPIIKPADDPCCNYREFDDVGEISSTMSGHYVLHHSTDKITVEFKLPEDCYLIIKDE